MRPLILAIFLAVLSVFHALTVNAQDIERATQLDRMCIGRMLIVQTMDYVKTVKGVTEQQYLEKEVYSLRLPPQHTEELVAVIHYVWTHTSEENQVFASAVMTACYEQNKGA